MIESTAVLWRPATAPLTRGQIVDVVGHASEAAVRKALARLVEQGIVLEQRVGKRYAYLANRGHLLWPSVEGVFRARAMLQERVERVIAGWEFAPASVELFGSIARGDSDETSDIDLLIVRPHLPAGGEETWNKQVADLHDQIVRWTGNTCDIVVLDPRELEQARQQDEPILHPPTTTLAGAPLAGLLSQPDGDLGKAVAALAQSAATQRQLRALSGQTAAMATSHEQCATVLQPWRRNGWSERSRRPSRRSWIPCAPSCRSTPRSSGLPLGHSAATWRWA